MERCYRLFPGRLAGASRGLLQHSLVRVKRRNLQPPSLRYPLAPLQVILSSIGSRPSCFHCTQILFLHTGSGSGSPWAGCILVRTSCIP